MRTYVPWLKKPPREYFIEQCYLTMDPDESTLGAMVALGVERNVLWGSDYPHFDCTYPGVLGEVREAIGSLPESSQRNILTDNAIRFYKM
jgi:predicted TIM-barrel fold metal-dependent hydrolase